MINKTGSTSVLGQVVMQKTNADNSYAAVTAGSVLGMGIVLLAGIPDGSLVPILICGKAQVLFAGSAAANRGKWAIVDSAAAGKAGRPAASPATGQGVGMILEAIDSETPVLVWCAVSFSKSSDVVGDPA
jgi:lipid-binding SYLF domain-containing protein